MKQVQHVENRKKPAKIIKTMKTRVLQATVLFLGALFCLYLLAIIIHSLLFE